MKEGVQVSGYDGLTSYYDVNLKNKRNDILLQNKKFSFNQGMLEDQEKIEKIFHEFNPDVVVHLAAQAGVGIV